ncbi:hypothetical protein PPL_08733 [Heterostelium album PN500]|uniref:Uncharacterized protein n=1 Tax=Heterostelium pallidum (strain ATCC 26659 / Pp 5 / PN500) TaxID=670386 RepID=D3BJK5_HETP5|nr:hypothetical protein PPL_08733 [Heterostelium album PN500]EFA78085.1 hypothetical protein PPL_08733 [Heterostelium album PN500]|eukprot:XP_020430212.1 hypothetical protein PPL_08733 [Heterostelium album PN500]
MNTPSSVVWGFVALTCAGMGALYVSRKEYMTDKTKRLEEARRTQEGFDVAKKERVVQSDGYALFDETKSDLNKKR